MSYKVTVYCNDPKIQTTEVYISEGDYTGAALYTFEYRQASAPAFEQTVDDSVTVRIRATAVDGYRFSHWVYHLNSAKDDTLTDYGNPFIHTSGKNLIIRAVSAQDIEIPTLWTLTGENLGSNVKSSVDRTSNYIEKEVHRYSISFMYSGTVDISVLANDGYYVYLSTNDDFDYTNGKPIDIITYYEDFYNTRDKFPQISYYVQAGITYYIWVRNIGEAALGNVDVTVTAPPVKYIVDVADLGSSVRNNITENIICEKNVLYRRQVSFEFNTVVRFYTTGSTNTYGYLSYKSEWDPNAGKPKDEYVYCSDDDSGDNNNFYFEYDVIAGEKYYVWVKAYSNGSTTLHIEPEKVTIKKWDWSISQSKASAEEVQKAYNAVLNKGYVSDFSYNVWNALVNRTKSILDTKSKSWSSVFLDFNHTLMFSTDKTLTAQRFNSLRFNVGSNVSTGINIVNARDIVLGEYFITIASCINTWIDNENLG